MGGVKFASLIEKEIMEKQKEIEDGGNETFVEENQKASDRNAQIGEGLIERYDDINPEHKAFEDVEEVQSTDDV